ncbi:MAG: undecaprenyl-diphosphate phosphatase [Deltaproteobacteria bacterium]|nr:undecaprenyl-diphosphate phosphatase [Deltaproteobacteria bacterium]
MDLLQSIVLGIVQGITEFLPISSTAHLALIPWFFKWNDPGLAFDVALHIGTLVAVIYYFWREWVVIIRGLIQGLLSVSFAKNPNGKLGVYIIIATIPGALSGFIFEEQASGILRHPIAIAVSVFFFGVILYVFDKFSRKEKGISDLNIFDCLVVGIAQAFAIIPGVSRSGVSITGGLIRLDYATVASPPFIVGILTSALFGFLSIKYLLRYLQAKTYTVFVIYRVALAAFILFLYFGR